MQLGQSGMRVKARTQVAIRAATGWLWAVSWDWMVGNRGGGWKGESVITATHSG